MTTAQIIVVTTTLPDETGAKDMLQRLLEQRLAACGHIHRVTSGYWWQGEIHNEREWVLSLKTRADLYTRLEKAVKEAHPYAVPMIVAVPVLQAFAPYAGWIYTETRHD